ncbi:MAG TPA: dual specificity protein phosphatase family protein [Candidatus Saccharimonadales bacterium]|nr:dual specificity protein phosphatase family protein [Candidatus Saccharimonadales bacterium]
MTRWRQETNLYDVHLYWIDPTLAIASRPRGGDWLDDEMADLKRQGVHIVVSCLTAPEELELGLTHEEHAASEHGLVFARSRIEDRETPSDSSTFAATIDRLAAERHAGRRVAIHCRQGLGRAPLVAASLLVRAGMAAENAWELITERRHQRVPDTEEQREWVRALERRRSPVTVPQGS